MPIKRQPGKRPVTVERILIAGYGSIGRRHLRLARELLPGADIRVLRHAECDFVPEYADGCFFDLQSAVKFAPQLVVVANPAPFHMRVAIPLAEAGAHLLIEKPLADTVEDVPHLIDLCKKKKRVLMTGYNLRFLPSLTRFRELVLSRKLIGRVLSVRCEIGQYLPSWRPDTDYREGVSARKALGGGALLELSHEIDYLRWIFGEIAWVKASLLRQSDLDIDVEDTAHLTLGFAGADDDRELVASVNMDFIRHDTTRTCVAIGAEGSLRWNGLTGEVEMFRRGGGGWETVFCYLHQRDESYFAEWHHLLGLIDMTVEPLLTGEDGLRALEVIDAIRQSSASGCIERMANLAVKDTST